MPLTSDQFNREFTFNTVMHFFTDIYSWIGDDISVEKPGGESYRICLGTGPEKGWIKVCFR